MFDKDWPELPFAHREHIGCTVDYVSGRNRYMGYLISLGNSLGAFRHKQDSTLVAEQTTIFSVSIFLRVNI